MERFCPRGVCGLEGNIDFKISQNFTVVNAMTWVLGAMDMQVQSMVPRRSDV